ncbi:hypothetical protein GCM10018952_40440 [Streptosporangium vulgare]
MTWIDAVEHIISDPYGVPRNRAITSYLGRRSCRLAGRSGSRPTPPSARPASRSARRTAFTSAVRRAIATGSEPGGPESSNWPPGSKVTRLPPGSGGRASAILAIGTCRAGAVRSKTRNSSSIPTWSPGEPRKQRRAKISTSEAFRISVSSVARPVIPIPFRLTYADMYGFTEP